jgi:integrase
MATLRKISGRYYGYFSDRNRTPRQKSVALGTGMKDVAKKKLARLVVKYHDGEFDPWRPSDLGRNLSFVEAAAGFMESRASLRPKTLRAYRFMLEGLALHLPPAVGVNDVTRKHIVPYVTDRAVSDATRRHRLRHARVFFRWAAAQGHASDDPTTGIKLDRGGDKLPAFFMPEQLKALVVAIEADTVRKTAPRGARTGDSLWLRDIVLFAAATGLRQGEILALRWDGIDLDPGQETLSVRNDGDFRTKSGRDVTLPLVGVALDVVRRRNGLRDEAPYVFPGQRGGKMNAHYLSRRFKAFVERAGLPDRLHFHSLRHTFGTQLARDGVPLLTISKLLGHSNTQITQVYTHLGMDELRSAMNRTPKPAVPTRSWALRRRVPGNRPAKGD